MRCPKFHFENPSDSAFCSKCGSQILPEEEISVSQTKTLEIPREELTMGSIFAGRYQIIEELGKGGMGKVYKVLDKEIKAKIALSSSSPRLQPIKAPSSASGMSSEWPAIFPIRISAGCMTWEKMRECTTSPWNTFPAKT